MNKIRVALDFKNEIDFIVFFLNKFKGEFIYPHQQEIILDYYINGFVTKTFNDIDLFLKEYKIIKDFEYIKIILTNESEIFINPKKSKHIGANFKAVSEINEFTFIISQHKIHYGLIHFEIDLIMSSESDISYWQYKNTPIPPYAKLIPKFDFDDKNAKQIDLESLPGHSHQTNGINDEGLWFGACWQMYFSEIYYKYIPKPLFDAFTDCFENVVLENGVRKITLYENPDDYDLPDSRRQQFEFRKQLGIDTIGHELTMPVDLYIDDNLPVYITKKNIAEGQTKVIRYLDATKNLVIKKKASFKETKIYLEDGVTVVFEQLEKKNFFGNFV